LLHDGSIKIGYSGKKNRGSNKNPVTPQDSFLGRADHCDDEKHGLTQVYSEDQHLASVPSITVINPYTKAKSTDKKGQNI
jgi:hypothetical protein